VDSVTVPHGLLLFVSQPGKIVGLEVPEIDFAQLDSIFRGFWPYDSSSTVLDSLWGGGFA